MLVNLRRFVQKKKNEEIIVRATVKQQHIIRLFVTDRDTFPVTSLVATIDCQKKKFKNR